MECVDYVIGRLELDHQIGTVVEDSAWGLLAQSAMREWGVDAPLSRWERDQPEERTLRIVLGEAPAEIAALWERRGWRLISRPAAR